MLFDLLPGFMQISAEVSHVLETPPNQDWMALACEFMLQAGIEGLQVPLLTMDADDVRAAQYPQLDDCYAWGLNAHEDGGEEDDFVARTLFGAPTTTDASSTRHVQLVEDPLWRELRTQSLSAFEVPQGSSREARYDRLRRLEDEHPVGPFVEDVVSFMDGVWTMCQSSFGPPVLVEMEEGHLRSCGLEGDRFDRFMLKVGLGGNDAKGFLKLKL